MIMVREFLRIYVYNENHELVKQLRCGITSNKYEDVNKCCPTFPPYEELENAACPDRSIGTEAG